MKDITDFLSAALPWICMGLLLAIFFAKSARKKDIYWKLMDDIRMEHITRLTKEQWEERSD